MYISKKRVHEKGHKASLKSEFRKHWRQFREHHSKNPPGLRLLTSLMIATALFYLFGSLLIPQIAMTTNIAGVELHGWNSIILKALSIIGLLALAHGLTVKKHWAYRWSLIAFIVLGINSAFTLMLGEFSSFAIVGEIVVLGSLTSIFVNMISAWYLFERKSLFLRGREENLFFIERVYRSMYILLAFFLLIFFIGFFFELMEVRNAPWDDILERVNYYKGKEALDSCDHFSETNQDVCKLSVLVKNPKDFYIESAEVNPICREFQGVIFRLACLKVVN